ncbi:MAG TPA: PilZ domain-containing protein [Pseudomonadales bacterium]|nr:PilZ domain-containing protein [Pseudomonadales bacterium]
MAMNPALAAEVVHRLLLWPDPMTSDADPAAAFHAWLQATPAPDRLHERCSRAELEAFFVAHGGVVAACRMAGAAVLDGADARDRARIRLVARAFLVVQESADHPASVGSVAGGLITDVSESGIGLETEVSLARGSVVRVTIAAPNPPLKVFASLADVRWCSGAGGRHQAGIRFREGDDTGWQRDFLSSFLPR